MGGVKRAGLAIVLAQATSLAPAFGQQTTMTLEGRSLSVTGAELRALSDLGRARSFDPAGQDRALAAAERVARGRDALYVLALYRLDIGQRRRDDALVGRALDVLIAAAGTPRGKLAGYLSVRGGIAFRRGDARAAAADWTRAAQMQPGDPQALMNLAQARGALGESGSAIELIRQAIDTRRTPPGRAPEAWHRQWLSIAFNGHLPDQTVAAGQALVTAYPSQENWRLALDLYRQSAAPHGDAEIAMLDQMRAIGVLTHSAEYQRLAQLLLAGNDPANARAVLDEGIGRGVVKADEPPTPAILRSIASAPARPVSRDIAARALLAAARDLAAGRRAAAESIFQTIIDHDAGSPPRWYGDIARFWLIRLSQSR